MLMVITGSLVAVTSIGPTSSGVGNSVLRMLAKFCSTVPSAIGLATVTVVVTEPRVPAARVPRFQVTVPPDSDPELLAVPNSTRSGRSSVRTTLVAGPVPVLA